MTTNKAQVTGLYSRRIANSILQMWSEECITQQTTGIVDNAV